MTYNIASTPIPTCKSTRVIMIRSIDPVPRISRIASSPTLHSRWISYVSTEHTIVHSEPPTVPTYHAAFTQHVVVLADLVIYDLVLILSLFSYLFYAHIIILKPLKGNPCKYHDR